MNKEFKVKVKEKIVENLVSVKVWTIFATMGLSGIMVFQGFMAADVFAGLNGGVISTVMAMREAFKVSKVKSSDNSENINV